MSRPVRLVHTSDVHLGYDSTRNLAREALVAVVDATLATDADGLLIVGDFFDNNRVSDELVAFAVRELARLDRPAIILPGNHDCFDDRSVYRRSVFLDRPDHIHLVDDTVGEGLHFPDLALEVWGRPVVDHHRGFRPLADVPRRRQAPWRVVLAHGHYEPPGENDGRSSPISPEEIAAVDCDYIALGHWDRRVDISAGEVVAYYSGAPYSTRLTEALLVQLIPGRGVVLDNLPLNPPSR